jgi:hypothetical protein
MRNYFKRGEQLIPHWFIIIHIFKQYIIYILTQRKRCIIILITKAVVVSKIKKNTNNYSFDFLRFVAFYNIKVTTCQYNIIILVI